MKRYYFVKRDGEIVEAETETQARRELERLYLDADAFALESVEDA